MTSVSLCDLDIYNVIVTHLWPSYVDSVDIKVIQIIAPYFKEKFSIVRE